MSHPALLLKAYLAKLDERTSKLEKQYDMIKLNNIVQMVNDHANKLNEKFDLNMQTLTKQMKSNSEIVQECREFISLFNTIFNENNLGQQKPALEQSTTEIDEIVEVVSSSGVVEASLPHIVVNLSDLGKKDSLDNIANTEGNNEHNRTKRSLKVRLDDLLSSFDYSF